MSIFDNILGNGEKKPAPITDLSFSSEASAYMAILYSCTETEDDRGELEIDIIVRLKATKRLLKNIESREILTEYYRMHSELGWESVIMIAAKQLSEESKKSVFINCFDLTFANSYIDDREKLFMDVLIIALKLDPAFIDSVTDFMRLKYY